MGRRLPLPFLISLILHALLAMLGAFYMVQRHIIERDMVAVDITRVVESPPKRRLSKRAIKPVRYQPKIATVAIKQNRVPQRIQTAIELPATSYTTGVVAATETPSLLASKDVYTISKPLSIEYKPVPLKMQPPQVSPKRASSTMASTIQLSTAPPNLDIDPTDFLVALYDDYCRHHKLPLVSADEQDFSEMTAKQIEWIESFIIIWDSLHV